MLTRILSFGLCFFFAAPQVNAFVLLSGPREAKLPVTPDQPSVTFVWDGTYPSVSDKDKLSEAFQDMTDEQIMIQILTLATQTWTDVAGSYIQLSFEQGDVNTDPNDLVHSIKVATDSNVSSAAYAAPSINAQDIIEDCDIVIGKNKVRARTLAANVIHELGHCLGLGHIHTNYASIMGYARPIGHSLALGKDDKAGVIYLYPDPAQSFDEATFAQCAVVPNTPGGKPPAPIWPFLMVLPAVLLASLVSRRSSLSSLG